MEKRATSKIKRGPRTTERGQHHLFEEIKEEEMKEAAN